MPQEKILILTADSSVGTSLEQKILQPSGYQTVFISDQTMAETLMRQSPYDLVIVGEQMNGGDGLAFGAKLAEMFPVLGLLWMSSNLETIPPALRAGFWGYLSLPIDAVEVTSLVENTLARQRKLRDWAAQETRRSTRFLQRRLDSLEMLQQVGRSVAGLLDLDSILTTVVDSAVDLTGAEEGSLLLLDEASGELYMRAARNFQDEFVRKFRLPIRDTLAGQVMRTGKPLALNTDQPQKIKTSYLVHTLIYVPLQVHGRVIGVLGVDNRQSGSPFLEDHLPFMLALANDAAIAIENARAYANSDAERQKLDMILMRMDAGVLVFDHENRLVLANQPARKALGLTGDNLVGKLARDIITHPDIIEILDAVPSQAVRSEVSLEDGRVFNAQINPVLELGIIITLHDITHLKELDRIKSDFVNTVSHDLRSPLTSILGYTELIERAGSVTPQQQEFIRRVQFSVHNITALINDLLDLGRIEAGYDARKEVIPIKTIIEVAVEGMRPKFLEKQLQVQINIPDGLPLVLVNPLRLRQMITNMIGNSVKYTPTGGKINIQVRLEQNQLILQIHDNGAGIPLADQPYIFDKFYRASNISQDIPGAGLGLAIVKSIVENHGGRIWVESTVGEGSTFTVVLPILQPD